MNIVPVEDHQTLERFIRLPWSIYKDDRYWVPPLISQERRLFNRQVHPFYEHAEVGLFLAQDEEGHPLGRIAAIVNHQHLTTYHDQTGFFGFFETVDSPEVAGRLLSAARDYLKQHGMTRMRGPASFSSNEQWGLLIEGFGASPVIMMPYNLPYYERLLTGYGLTKCKDLYAYYVDRAGLKVSDRLLRIAERLKARADVVVRHPDMKRFDRELRIIREVYNRAWQANWGAVPMTEAEMEYLAHDLKSLIRPELALIAEVAGNPAGFCLSLPDYNPILKKLNGHLSPLGLLKAFWLKRRIKTLRLITLGVVKEYQKRGIDVIFYLETIKQGLRLGYQAAELSWVLEDNDLMNRTIQSLGARIYKRYRLYEMDI